MQLTAHSLKVRARRARSLLLVAVVVLHASPTEAVSQLPESSSVVASVGDLRIFDADLDQWWQAQDASAYQRLRRETYDGRRRALDALLSQRLLAAEAARRGTSVEDLLESEVARRTKSVTDADVSAFVSSNPMPAGASPSVVAPLVEALLRQRAREAAREEYLSALRREATARVKVFLEPPRVFVPRAAHNPTKGPGGAPVDVVMFSDFECPFCRRAEPVLARLLERFPTEVQLAWRHYPLSIHLSASEAAEAAQCAHDQGRFWAYHDALFADPSSLQLAGFRAIAQRLDLDMEAFERCISADVHAADVSSDREAGDRAGVSGTPTVFINGVAFVGALSYEVYERAVLEELARVSERQR